jgi:hypothetical protein
MGQLFAVRQGNDLLLGGNSSERKAHMLINSLIGGELE